MTMSLQRLLKGELKWDSDIPTAVVPPKWSDKINCVYRNTILDVTLLKRAAELGLLKESDLSDMYHDPGCPSRQLAMYIVAIVDWAHSFIPATAPTPWDV